MKKKLHAILSLTLIAILALSLFACKPADKDTETTDSKTEETKAPEQTDATEETDTEEVTQTEESTEAKTKAPEETKAAETKEPEAQETEQETTDNPPAGDDLLLTQPDGDSLAFTSDIYRVHVSDEGAGIVAAAVLKTKQELNDTLLAISSNVDITAFDEPTLQTATDALDDAFFEKYDVLLVFKKFGTSSVNWEVKGLYPHGPKLKVAIRTYDGGNHGGHGRQDMAYYYALIQVEKGAVDNYEIIPLYHGNNLEVR